MQFVRFIKCLFIFRKEVFIIRSVMAHNFSQVPKANIQRSSFDRSNGYKTTFDSGYLVPIFLDEVLPGDTFNLHANLFSRLATPVVPIMDNLFLETFFFFVPCRLVWDKWQRFNGEQENPGDSIDFLVPTLNSGSGFEVGSLADYFGLPTGVPNLNVNALPFRCYSLIYREWFRDENLQNSPVINKGDSDSISNYQLFRRGKRHDYFTSCLPWPAKNGVGVEIPLGTSAPVVGQAHLPNIPIIAEASSTTMTTAYHLGVPGSEPITFNTSDGVDPNNDIRVIQPSRVGHKAMAKGGDYTVTGLYADLNNAAAYTVNTLREAFQIQIMLERDARSGTRYTEILRGHFGVISPDARLQRPEYLGGSSTRININPVAQTGSTDSTTPQGNLAAFGTAGDSFHGFTKSFTEHGYIIGLVNVRADLTYQQGVDRLWSRQTRYDFYWPSLAHLGEQAVLLKELYAQGNAADDTVFGYQERYAEYRYKPSKITGKFRSSYAQSLDVWHLSQYFENAPTLSADFIEDKPPIERVVAVTDEPQFLLDCYFKLSTVRPMPVYSVPGLIDHF